MIKTIVSIDGMACGMCEAHINDTIRGAFPVKSVKASHKKGCAEILSEEPISAEALHKVIDPTGYTVLGVRTEEYVKRGFFHRG